MILIIIQLKCSCGGLIAERKWGRGVEVGSTTRRGQARLQGVAAVREPVAGVVRTAREEAEENKRSRCAFRGDLVKDIARMAVRKDRGPRVDNSNGVFRRVSGYPVERRRNWSSWGCEKECWA